MTNNQLIQEYEFDPTLTTSELLEAEIKAAELKERKEHRNAMVEAEKALSEIKRATAKALNAFLKNPTIRNAEKASELVDFHSDFYKDVNGMRPRWMWEKEFKSFTPEHKRVWEAAQ